jgi:hypothetical protein
MGTVIRHEFTPLAPQLRTDTFGSATGTEDNLSLHVFFFPGIKKPRSATRYGVSVLKPGNDLLSHGDTPHYHRRCIVSLLSSEWNQVGPMLYGRQANWLKWIRSYVR